MIKQDQAGQGKDLRLPMSRSSLPQSGGAIAPEFIHKFNLFMSVDGGRQLEKLKHFSLYVSPLASHLNV